ncbi:hypothetical protein RJ55_04237 [Drechmeria coniospora]|nr:hypothetical protein RJ55_04237 [Drechmeria coniospora]
MSASFPRLRVAVLVAALAFLSPFAAADQKPLAKYGKGSGNPFDDDFARFANETLHRWHVPGLSIAVVDGQDIYAKGYGFASLPAMPARPETLWYAASTTKAFTAAVLSHLIHADEHEALARGWDTPIASIIRDDFVLQDEWATAHVTLEDAVSHRTGMPRHDITSRHLVDGRAARPRDIVRNLRNLPLTAEPRVRFQYCNLMYVALSHVVETLTGRWLGRVLGDTIWAPLGMNATYFDLDDALAAPTGRLAQGYWWSDADAAFREVPRMPVTEASGAGAVFSTVLDYARWVRSLLREAGPLSPAVHRDIKTPRIVVAMPSNGRDVETYGLGWERSAYRGQPMYTHSGGNHGFGAEVYWFPDIGYGVVAFANTAMTSNAAEEALIFALVDAKLGIAPEDRVDVDKKWRDIMAGAQHMLDNALDDIYPDRPETPAPATVAMEALAGTYHDPGYGNMTLQVDVDPDDAAEKILVGSRPDDTWPMEMKMHHISADYWILFMVMPQNPTVFFKAFAAAQFKFDVAGRAKTLEVQFRLTRSQGVGTEAPVVFRRLD